MKKKYGYIFYENKTGNILGISSKKIQEFSKFNFIKVLFPEIEGFLVGNKNPSDYYVGISKKSRTRKSLIKIENFKSSNLRLVEDTYFSLKISDFCSNAEFLIEYCNKSNILKFFFNNSIISKLDKKEISTIHDSFKIFYLVKEDDPSFLIEKIKISYEEILEKGFVEYNIKTKENFDIFSKKIFNSYNFYKRQNLNIEVENLIFNWSQNIDISFFQSIEDKTSDLLLKLTEEEIQIIINEESIFSNTQLKDSYVFYIVENNNVDKILKTLKISKKLFETIDQSSSNDILTKPYFINNKEFVKNSIKIPNEYGKNISILTDSTIGGKYQKLNDLRIHKLQNKPNSYLKIKNKDFNLINLNFYPKSNLIYFSSHISINEINLKNLEDTNVTFIFVDSNDNTILYDKIEVPLKLLLEFNFYYNINFKNFDILTNFSNICSIHKYHNEKLDDNTKRKSIEFNKSMTDKNFIYYAIESLPDFEDRIYTNEKVELIENYNEKYLLKFSYYKNKKVLILTPNPLLSVSMLNDKDIKVNIFSIENDNIKEEFYFGIKDLVKNKKILKYIDTNCKIYTNNYLENFFRMEIFE